MAQAATRKGGTPGFTAVGGGFFFFSFFWNRECVAQFPSSSTITTREAAAAAAAVVEPQPRSLAAPVPRILRRSFVLRLRRRVYVLQNELRRGGGGRFPGSLSYSTAHTRMMFLLLLLSLAPTPHHRTYNSSFLHPYGLRTLSLPSPPPQRRFPSSVVPTWMTKLYSRFLLKKYSGLN